MTDQQMRYLGLLLLKMGDDQLSEESLKGLSDRLWEMSQPRYVPFTESSSR